MSETCTTVAIVSEDAPEGFKIINETDLQDGDVLFVAEDQSGSEEGKNKNMTVAEIKAALDEKGIAYTSFANKAALTELLAAAE